MASCSSRLGEPSFKALFAITILIISLLSGSCSATRPGFQVMRIVERDNKVEMVAAAAAALSSEQTYKLRAQKGFGLRGQAFNYLPKGQPVPPSGPSKRHNSSPKN